MNEATECPPFVAFMADLLDLPSLKIAGAAMMNDQIEQTATPQQPVAPAQPRTFAGMTAVEMAQHRANHGEEMVKAATVPLGDGKSVEWIYRAPSRLEYDRHTETLLKIRDGKVGTALGADRTIVLSCTLAPAAEVLDGLLNKYPALAAKLSEPIMKLAGAEIEVREETF